MTDQRMEKRLRAAGLLILIGLVIELVSLISPRPTPFYFFLFAGGAVFLVVGLIIYLLSLVSRSAESG